MSLHVDPGPASGSVPAPPSKSATHRAYVLAAHGDGCDVRGPLQASSTDATLAGLRALGAAADVRDGGIRFAAAGWRRPAQMLDCGGSATALRLLAATAGLQAGPVRLTGDASLRRRPHGALAACLSSLGARCDGRWPLQVRGPLRPGRVEVPAGASSQVASALALALPFCAGPSEIVTAGGPGPGVQGYLGLTLDLAARAGLRFEPDGRAVRIEGGQRVTARRLDVEGDWSSAAFLLGAGAIAGGPVAVSGLDPQSLQPDRAVVALLRAFGADVRTAGSQAVASGGPLHSPGVVDIAATPDLFPILSVVAACSAGTTTFVGGAGLRGKESDRIDAMAQGLARMGVAVRPTGDGLVVRGGRLAGAHVAAHGDHRVHMALAVAALAAGGPSTVEDAASVHASFPGFHDALQALGAGVRILRPLAEAALP